MINRVLLSLYCCFFFGEMMAKTALSPAVVSSDEAVVFKSVDGVEVFANLFFASPEPEEGKNAPTILLFHQARSNALAEYRDIFPTLLAKGFNLWAVDLREGGDKHGGQNRTAKNWKNPSPDAYCLSGLGMEAALQFIENQGFANQKILWGSGFGAALAIDLASRKSGALAFAPTQGGSISPCEPNEAQLSTLKTPLLVVRAKSEMSAANREEQAALFKRFNIPFVVAESEQQGSLVLDPLRNPGGVDAAWRAVFDFLENIFGPVQKSGFDLAAVRQHIEAANQGYGERFQNDDPEFYKARYTADACIMPEKMPRLCGRDAIRGYYYNGGQNRDFRLKITATEVSGGESAVIEEGTYDLTDKAGALLDRGKFIATWVLEDKKWKLRREIWTTDLAPVETETQMGYDSTLAQKLGADNYGMKKYVLVLLKTGPAEIADKAEVERHFAGHMANMGRLAAEGKLILAGPIGKKEKYRGLFVFEVASIEEAKALAATDPAIQAGLLEPEFMPYYGSAALKMVNEWHERVQKIKF